MKLTLLVTMIFTFCMIMIANIVKPTNPQRCPLESVTFQQAQETSDQEIIDCYCKDYSFTEILGDNEKKDLCWQTYLQLSYTYLLIALTGMVVVIVNWLLKLIIMRLARFMRYATFTLEISQSTINLTFAMFINTAIITLLLQAKIGETAPAIYIAEPIPQLKELQQQNLNSFSADFDRTWYNEVGSKIITTMMFNILTPHFTSLIFLPCVRRYRDSKCRSQAIQKDMNRWIVGEKFDLVYAYALSINTIFVSLLFSSGMPLLLWTCSFTLFLQYWCFKYLLLRFNKKPPAYDHKLSKTVISLLPYAMILHLCVGIYM